MNFENPLIRSLSDEFRRRLVATKILSSPWLIMFRRSNGMDRKITLGVVWQLYKRDHLPTISEASRALKIYRCERFLVPLEKIRMCEMTPQVIAEFIRFSKENYAQRSPSRKFNFDKELKDLRSIFNWYQETVDFRFATPFRASHLKLGVMAEIPRKNRRITLDQFQAFLGKLPEFYRDFALIQFFCGARVGEIAGLQVKNIDFENRVLKIQEVLVWIKGQPKIKSCPKNGLSREVFINDTMAEILRRRIEMVPPDCPFVFHREGLPLLYNAIGAAYNKGWRRAGLPLSGTHTMRISRLNKAVFSPEASTPRRRSRGTRAFNLRTNTVSLVRSSRIAPQWKNSNPLFYE